MTPCLEERRVEIHVTTTAILQNLHVIVHLPMPLAPWCGLSPLLLLFQLERALFLLQSQDHTGWNLGTPNALQT